jgi:Fe2+ transport system protein FeoA
LLLAAELAMVPEPIKMDQDRLRKELYKSAQMNKRVIQNLEDDLVRSADKFLKMAKDLTSRSTGFEELSASSVDDNTFAKIASLLYPGSGPRKDWAGFIHKSASINVAEDLAITYVRLSSIDKELGLRKQAQLKVEELEKAGFFTLGRVVGKTVAWPVKTLGKAVANTAQGVGKVIKTKTQNTVADTGLGKSLKVPKVEMPNNIKRNLSVLGATTGAAFDAASYTPKTDPASGRMGDVWDAIRK